eukprot:CAMPEP_0198238662 /NCGR_PEP_ID=MMETSP1446-20131203/4275_1 /TAXON_ID=1461542 ORGANISM="Unidentified sp, Strain CCMP2111" /NCGR_SAMPLE_ID=MMETSP1446 /ASSEMBLY_ACC=CAM_ASM_001112 /LENGTH=219 /DNA_ID=CAMNT_0043921129 /DNA_START=104 /DNA_END=760 /DNA_ORIENTATION=-
MAETGDESSGRQKRMRTDCDTSDGADDVLNEGDFENLRREMREYDEMREKIIKTSRDVQKLSKQAIFSLHRKDFKRAEEQLSKALSTTKTLLPLVKEKPTLRYGSFSNALEEYAEARIFQHYLSHGKLLTSTAMEDVEKEEYLGGVLDFSGELNRYAVARATARDIASVKKCRDLVEKIMDQYLQFDFRNSSLRKKYDALKYTLKNMEVNVLLPYWHSW